MICSTCWHDTSTAAIRGANNDQGGCCARVSCAYEIVPNQNKTKKNKEKKKKKNQEIYRKDNSQNKKNFAFRYLLLFFPVVIGVAVFVVCFVDGCCMLYPACRAPSPRFATSLCEARTTSFKADASCTNSCINNNGNDNNNTNCD